ncbi:MAG: hypothetical protein E6916_08590 [Clostridium cochlearium]|uniref:hypothetical protein n=1 Tax=Clostridium cochlearium TaxID=1494 RepID=UPI00280B82DE|nr:hypothetical protein [Clostridium cochlearium]MDU1443558.1 hypothetical protein [Clostridium cochlearium]
MNFKDVFKQISLEEVVNKEKLLKEGFKYVLVYFYDKVLLDKLENVDLNIENIIECRIFNENKEIHIFKVNGKLKAILFNDSKWNKDDIICEEYLTIDSKKDKNHRRYGKKIKVFQYIDYDEEDGQAYISYTRPYKVEF